jgi:hypothetical protein
MLATSRSPTSSPRQQWATAGHLIAAIIRSRRETRAYTDPVWTSFEGTAARRHPPRDSTLFDSTPVICRPPPRWQSRGPRRQRPCTLAPNVCRGVYTRTRKRVCVCRVHVHVARGAHVWRGTLCSNCVELGISAGDELWDLQYRAIPPSYPSFPSPSPSIPPPPPPPPRPRERIAAFVRDIYAHAQRVHARVRTYVCGHVCISRRRMRMAV